MRINKEIVKTALLQELERRVNGEICCQEEIVTGEVRYMIRYYETNINSIYTIDRDIMNTLCRNPSEDDIDDMADKIVMEWKRDIIDRFFKR